MTPASDEDASPDEILDGRSLAHEVLPERTSTSAGVMDADR